MDHIGKNAVKFTFTFNAWQAVYSTHCKSMPLPVRDAAKVLATGNQKQWQHDMRKFNSILDLEKRIGTSEWHG